ncbi:Flavoprotein [Penicillium lagena]|uniref:Flavoprotein n=1 Tax=Penicillium lagena TaxID=94218 RepID=UPI0025404D5A|nr:Flavoprotein [Penicillium lagena]KAJ5613035.1 Flavoprotein [Penicillium lagena]
MAVGVRPEPTTPTIQRPAAKGAWASGMEVDGDCEETAVIGNEEGYRVCSEKLPQIAPPTPSSQARRQRLLLSTDGVFADTVLPSLVQNPYLELRLITDEPSALLAGTNKIPHYMDTVDSQTFDKKTGARKWLKAKTAELCEWADMLLVAPIDAGALGSMLAGLTNTLTLALLRGWVSTKPVVLIPGMTVSEWDHPLSARQLDEIKRFFPWIQLVEPVLWKSNGPEDLTPLPWGGIQKLHETLQTALQLPLWGDTLATNAALGGAAAPANPTLSTRKSSGGGSAPTLRQLQAQWPKPQGNAHFLPLEIWLSIFEDQLGDWEIAKAVGIPSNLPVPQEWQSHLLKMSTPASLEYTILRGSFASIKKRIEALPRWKPLSDLACHLIVKFSRTDILTYLTENHLDLLWTTSRLTNIPYRASAIYGNPSVLTWWRDAPALPNKEYKADAVDGASRAGFLHVLDWWLHSGLPLRYSERALEAASAEGRVEVLDWWKTASANTPVQQSPLPLKVGKSVLLAAQSGRTESLAWWDASGIPYSHAENVARIASTHGHVHVLQFWYQLKGPKMIFDNQVLVGPTKNGHDHVLQWWKTCGLRVEFKTCDIEEALEDADPASGAEGRVRRWWERNGLNLGVGTSEWMKSKVL